MWLWVLGSRLRLDWPCGRLGLVPWLPITSLTGVGRKAIGLTKPTLLLKFGTPPMGVMLGGGWEVVGLLWVSGMMGGGEGVTSDIEAELSEAKESCPESHILITALSSIRTI